MIFKLFKFGIVGLTGLLIDFSITYILKEKVRIHRYLASSCGFIVAASSNYLLNRLWTFQSQSPHVLIEYGSFILVSVIGLGINNLFLFLFEKKWRFYFAKLCAIAVTTLWNFTANYYITFN